MQIICKLYFFRECSRHLLHHLRRPLRRRRRCRFPPLPPSEPALPPSPHHCLAASRCRCLRPRAKLAATGFGCARSCAFAAAVRGARSTHARAKADAEGGLHMHVTCTGAVCVVCSVLEDVRACRAAAAWMQLFCAPPSHVMVEIVICCMLLSCAMSCVPCIPAGRCSGSGRVREYV